MDTNNRAYRIVPLNEALTAASKDAMSSPIYSAAALVLHRNGQPVKSIRKAFANACRDAGLSDVHFHQFRPMAVMTMR